MRDIFSGKMPMRDFFVLREDPNQVRAGLTVIVIAVAGYTLMQAIFFGAPHFTFDTWRGVASTFSALSTLWMAGTGAWSICIGIQRRRRAKR